jgi:sortase A
VTRHILQWPLAAVLATAAFFLLQSLWIPAKAELAQWLLESAWRRTLNGETDARPWPWADTRPVAVLQAPRQDVRQIVLEGASGRNLAFGPATVTATGQRDLVISGHRDTHFRFLGDLAPGDPLHVRTPGGERAYRVSQMEVVDSRAEELVVDPGLERLTLITCYPLDAPAAGGPLRLVVTALPQRSIAAARPLFGRSEE